MIINLFQRINEINKFFKNIYYRNVVRKNYIVNHGNISKEII